MSDLTARLEIIAVWAGYGPMADDLRTAIAAIENLEGERLVYREQIFALRAKVEALEAERDRLREALEIIKNMPCITALLGDDLGDYGCGCPSCGAKRALAPPAAPAEETGQAQGCGCTVTMTCAYHGASESASRFGGSDVGPPAAEGCEHKWVARFDAKEDRYTSRSRIRCEKVEDLPPAAGARPAPRGKPIPTLDYEEDFTPTPSARLDEIAREVEAHGTNSIFGGVTFTRDGLKAAIRKALALDAARGAK